LSSLADLWPVIFARRPLEPSPWRGFSVLGALLLLFWCRQTSCCVRITRVGGSVILVIIAGKSPDGAIVGHRRWIGRRARRAPHPRSRTQSGDFENVPMARRARPGDFRQRPSQEQCGSPLDVRGLQPRVPCPQRVDQPVQRCQRLTRDSAVFLKTPEVVGDALGFAIKPVRVSATLRGRRVRVGGINRAAIGRGRLNAHQDNPSGSRAGTRQGKPSRRGRARRSWIGRLNTRCPRMSASSSTVRCVVQARGSPDTSRSLGDENG